MATKAQIRAINKYNRANTTQVSFRFNKTTDADVLEKLETVTSKAGYVKSLIRQDLRGEK